MSPRAYVRLLRPAGRVRRFAAALSSLSAACTILGAPACAVAADVPAYVEEPRAFGHTVGDMLTQRILLAAGGRVPGEVAMPSAGRVDVWLERRAARVETDTEGRRWMVVDYQVTNAPRVLTRIALPALALKTRDGDVLHVPEWPASIGPLAPDSAFDADALQAMRPDRLAAPAALAPIRRQLSASLAALAATLFAWAAWWVWRNRREEARLPFARAWRQMRQLGSPQAQSDIPWRVMHRALNETAGHVVHAGSLAALVGREPWLQPLQPQLARFYRQSEARFFAPQPNDASRTGYGDADRDVDGKIDGHTEGHVQAHVERHTEGDPERRIEGSAHPFLVALSRSLYRAERRRQR
jgi:mxaA protein